MGLGRQVRAGVRENKTPLLNRLRGRQATLEKDFVGLGDGRRNRYGRKETCRENMTADTNTRGTAGENPIGRKAKELEGCDI